MIAVPELIGSVLIVFLVVAEGWDIDIRGWRVVDKLGCRVRLFVTGLEACAGGICVALTLGLCESPGGKRFKKICDIGSENLEQYCEEQLL